MFFATDAGDFTCLAGSFLIMWEILHACRESGRNSVQAGELEALIVEPIGPMSKLTIVAINQSSAN